MKRKASVLDDTPSSGDWLHSDSSTVTTSPESAHTRHNAWQIPAIPYLNCRTRKRHRDGRPDEEAIHQNTIAKLFNAQRKIHNTEVAEQRRSQQVGSYLMSLDTFEPNFANQHEPESRQTSLDAFFGGTFDRQRQRHSHSLRPTFQPVASDSFLRCEDCASTLGKADNAMDVDMETGIYEADWACASCSRTICDTCAVRGDQRICLECAIPGGG